MQDGLSTIKIWGWVILCCGAFPVQCGVFCPLDAWSILVGTTKNAPRQHPKFPEGQNHPQLRTTRLKGRMKVNVNDATLAGVQVYTIQINYIVNNFSY